MDISMIMAIPVLPSAPINYGDDRGAPAGRRRRPRGYGWPAATSGQLNSAKFTPKYQAAGLRPAGGDDRGAPAGRRLTPEISIPSETSV